MLKIPKLKDFPQRYLFCVGQFQWLFCSHENHWISFRKSFESSELQNLTGQIHTIEFLPPPLQIQQIFSSTGKWIARKVKVILEQLFVVGRVVYCPDTNGIFLIFLTELNIRRELIRFFLFKCIRTEMLFKSEPEKKFLPTNSAAGIWLVHSPLSGFRVVGSSHLSHNHPTIYEEESERLLLAGKGPDDARKEQYYKKKEIKFLKKSSEMNLNATE